MLRPGFVLCVLIGLALSGCEQRQDHAKQSQSPAPAAKPWFSGGAQQGPGLHLAYTHQIGLEVANGALSAHFLAARDRCLTNPSHHCILIHADIAAAQAGQGDEASDGAASLRVRLPHDQIAPFTNALTDRLPGETSDLVQVVRQSSTAEDLGQPVADAGQRVAQLTDYLASLKVLGGRLTLSVADQVKIAGETAQAQTQLEEAQARQRELALRVDTEELDVDFADKKIVQDADPVPRVLAGAQESLRKNTAEALQFSIAALPWVPVAFVGLVVLWIARRVVFGRRLRA
jgi:hypothetical protein